MSWINSAIDIFTKAKPVVLVDNAGSPIATGNPLACGKAFVSSATATRPNDTTAYAASDVVAGVLEFQNAGPPGGVVLITDVRLMVSVSSVPSGMATMRLHIYSATPPSAFADNAAWDLPSGDRSAYLGYIDIGTPADLGSTLWIEKQGANKTVKLAAGQTSLFGYLVTTAGYTPTAQAGKTLVLCSVGVG